MQIMRTFAIPFDPERADEVEAKLVSLGKGALNDGAIRDALTGKGIHFMSMLVARAPKPQPTYLVCELNADGPEDALDAALNRLAQPLLDEVLSSAGVTYRGSLATFLGQHEVKIGQGLLDTAGLDFPGTPGMTVDRIEKEFALARLLRDFLDSRGSGGNPLQILADAKLHVASKPDMKALLQPKAVPQLDRPTGKLDVSFIARLAFAAVVKFLWPLLVFLGLAVAVAVVVAGSTSGPTLAVTTLVLALGLSVVALVAAVAWTYLALRRAELSAVPDDSPPDPRLMDEISERENVRQQNLLCAISVVHPGPLRALTLRIALWVIGEMSIRRYRPGFLGDLGTIHFARWVLLPKTRNLLFLSNYGGSWESYLEDFITKASTGLTGVWSNTQGFPKASNLFFEGAADGDRFKRWARRQQLPTRFWYSAYPYLTTARIRTNAAIRQGLCNATTRDEAGAWLRLFGSSVRPDALLETREIQTLLFGGLGRHAFATYLAVRLPTQADQAKAWLSEAAARITFGDAPPLDKVLVVALSRSGFERLHVPREIASGFPHAFRDGMASRTRAKILSDTGDDKPSDWLWGASEKETDGMLLIYADTADRLGTFVAEVSGELVAHGGSVLHKVAPSELPQPDPDLGSRPLVREAFGFADGVSQPVIKGTRRWMRSSDAIHTVEPGEFLLGYPDNRGFYPPSPVLPAAMDGNALLPLQDQSHSRGLSHPYFPHGTGDSARDFGRNGSFLVVRQLEQDVPKFKDFLKDAAVRHQDDPAIPSWMAPDQREEWIGAKMVGRWKNGTSLVRFPHGPGGRQPDNDFLPGAEDPLGMRCPLGSHIRRANPRESKAPGSAEELSIVNRHRILRVGRSYEAAGSGDAESKLPGLMFMCLNADIERQFEFIQQTWLMSGQFHDLENEVDPIMGRGLKMGRLAIPSDAGPLNVTGLKDFVRVRGGGYFFMPSRSAIEFLAAGPPEPVDRPTH